MNEKTTQERATGDARGFSMVEAIIGMALMVVIMAMAFTFYVNTSKTFRSEQSGQDMQAAARVAVDELARALQQIGFGIDRPDANNPGGWQRALIYGDTHTLAFNADLDPDLGPINASRTLTFPSGETYKGEGAAVSISGSESYVYSLDANGDNLITTADRTAAETGGFNPAAGTDNPLDFALFRRVHGYDGTGYTSVTTPIIGYLYSNALDSIEFADGTVPDPIFTYVLTEDLNLDGELADSECVNDEVDTCPPATARQPLNYLWGDTDFDGILSDTEKDELRTLPVGSPAWSKNHLVSSGAYRSTSLATAVDPDSPFAFVLGVDDASKMALGAVIQIGTGTDAEFAVVSEIDTTKTPSQVHLSTMAGKAHAVGTTVAIVPSSFLRAVRAVRISLTAMTPRKDRNSHEAPVGQIGRGTAHGMDYRTMTLERTVELPNATTIPVRPGWVTSGKGPLPCPLVVTATCGGNELENVSAAVGSPVELAFNVTDLQGNAVEGASVVFSRTGDAGGALSSGFDSSNNYGEVEVNYTATGLVGTDTVTAKVTCEGTDYTASVEISVQRVEVSLANDCLTTVGTRTPNPTASFTAEVHDVDGIVADAPIAFRLHLDNEWVSPANDYASIQADLYEGYSLVTSTSTDGWSSSHDTTTGGGGTLSGSVRLSKDYSDGGTRVHLIASTPDVACESYGANASFPVTFYKLELDSVTPISGCTENTPCTIVPYGDAPEIRAHLSVAGRDVAGAPLTFSTEDTHGSPDDPPAVSVLDPGGAVSTDGTGAVTVYVANNGSASITPSNPLETLVDVSSTGESGICNNGAIVPVDPRLGFEFQGPTEVASCAISMGQAWGIQRDGDTRFCINGFNANEMGDCGLKVTGVQVTLYALDGVTPVTFPIKKIEGGAVTAGPYCGDPRVTLFDPKCNGGVKLANGDVYMFADTKDCDLPPTNVGAQQYFVLKKIEWDGKFKVGQKVDVTLYYDCVDTCSDKIDFSTSYSFTIPN